MASEPGENMLNYSMKRNVKNETLIGIVLVLMPHCSV